MAQAHEMAAVPSVEAFTATVEKSASAMSQNSSASAHTAAAVAGCETSCSRCRTKVAAGKELMSHESLGAQAGQGWGGAEKSAGGKGSSVVSGATRAIVHRCRGACAASYALVQRVQLGAAQLRHVADLGEHLEVLAAQRARLVLLGRD